MSKETLSFVTPPPPKNYKISSAFSYNFKLALTDHLNDLYTAFSQKGTRKGEARAAAKIDLVAQLKARKITRVSIAKGSGLSERIIPAAVKGEKVSIEAARAVSDALGLKLEDAFEVKGDDRPLSAKLSSNITA